MPRHQLPIAVLLSIVLHCFFAEAQVVDAAKDSAVDHGESSDHKAANRQDPWRAELDVKSSTVIDATKEELTDITFSHNGKLLIGATQQGIRIWEHSEEEGSKVSEFGDRPIQDLAVLPNSKHLFARTNEGFDIWDIENRELVHRNDSLNVTTFAIATDRNVLLTASSAGVVSVRDLSTMDMTQSFDSIGESIVAISCDSDGSVVVAVSETGQVAKWMSLQDEPTTWENPFGPVNDVTVSPDGTLVILGHSDGSHSHWRPDSDSLLFNYPAPEGHKDAACEISPLGRFGFYISNRTSNQAEIRVRRTNDLDPLLRLIGHDANVICKTVSPDGEHFAAVGNNGEIHVWNRPIKHAETWQLRRQIAQYSTEIEDPDNARFQPRILHQRRAFVHAKLKEFHSAAADFQRAQELAPHDSMHWMRAGIMLLLAKQNEKYREHALEMLDHFGDDGNAYEAERTAKLLVLPKEPVGDQQTAERLAAFGTENSGNSPWAMYFPTTEALVKYRYGEYDAGLTLIEQSRNRNLPGQDRPDVAEMLNHVVEALCWAAKGESRKAKSALNSADEYLDPFREHPTTVTDSSRHDWLIGQILYEEAIERVQMVNDAR